MCIVTGTAARALNNVIGADDRFDVKDSTVYPYNSIGAVVVRLGILLVCYHAMNVLMMLDGTLQTSQYPLFYIHKKADLPN